jgi:very-short-patch-repair endonuclease
LVLDEIFERSGFVVLPNQKLSQIIYRRPPDITNEQWSYATRAQFDFVVCNATTYMPDFAVELDDPTHRKPEAQRRDRMKDALCEAAGLELLRIESSALYPGPHGRRILEYLVDARSFMQAVWEQQEAGLLPQDEPFDYRNAIGRLPNGRLGFINDLGTLARLAAIDAHDKKLVASPIIQGLSLYWKDGWAEGWGWLHLKDDLYFFERVQVREYRFYCGIGAGDLAQDLAAAAVGEKLRLLGSDEPILSRWSEIKRAFERVKERRVELDDHFLIDHTSFQ